MKKNITTDFDGIIHNSNKNCHDDLRYDSIKRSNK